MDRCENYFQLGMAYRCYAHEHSAECSCGGDRSKCDFFPGKRNPKPPKPMDELKKQLVEACERKLNYYDVVNETAEMVEYGLIVDFLFEQIAGLMTGGAEGG